LVLFHPARPGEAFATQDGRVLRSVDGGRNWQPLDDERDGRVWPAALMVLPELPDRLYALFPGGEYRSTLLTQEGWKSHSFRSLQFQTIDK
jgi:photosystem II stability/assembly factor-like uncharacterized protein